MLLCGLDGSGKTSMIKRYTKALDQFSTTNKDTENPFANVEFYTSTPFINMERIELPNSNNSICVVYDVSGQGRYRDSW